MIGPIYKKVRKATFCILYTRIQRHSGEQTGKEMVNGFYMQRHKEKPVSKIFLLTPIFPIKCVSVGQLVMIIFSIKNEEA